MEKNPGTISKKKFLKMAVPRQHKLLSQWAGYCFEQQKGLEAFKERYEVFHDWVELDRFNAGPWLDDEEYLQECAYFHASLAGFDGDVMDEEVGPVQWQPTFDVTLVLDQVRSPYNLGSMIRLADNFGFKGVVHSSRHMSLKHPRLQRSARGAQHWIPVEVIEDLPTWLNDFEGTVVGVEADSRAISLADWKPQGRIALVMGNEAYGISKAIRELCDELVQIPMFGLKRSMNVGMAAAVVGEKLVLSKSIKKFN